MSSDVKVTVNFKEIARLERQAAEHLKNREPQKSKELLKSAEEMEKIHNKG